MAGLAVLSTPAAAMPQPASRVYRIGSLTRGGREAAAPYNRALEEGLARLGWIDGRNVTFEHRYADLKPERYPELAAGLIRSAVDVIVAPSTPAALVVKRATTKIPIVTTVALDPVGAGLVASLARPGANVTGLTIDTGPELGAKLLQLLKEAVPSTARVVLFREAGVQPGYAPYAAAMEAAGRSLGITLAPVDMRGPADLDRAFAAALRERPDGLLVAHQAMAITHAEAIAAFASRARLPTIARTTEFANAGGLVAYATDIVDLYRKAAVYVDRILRGAQPADLPVEQPTKFELVVNLRTAAALGVTIPRAMLVRADRVIE